MITGRIAAAYRNAEISTKITVTYAACFIALLIITNAVMYFGVVYALYRPAELTIKHSMQRVHELLDAIAQDVMAFDTNSIREPLIAGVVLRVVDENGEVFIDTDPHYPSIEMFDADRLDYTPILAADDMEIAEIGNAWVYRAHMDYTFAGDTARLYFFRTITSEKFLLENLKKLLLILDVAGILLAVGVGNLTSRKVLKPIKTIISHAQNIAFGKMGGRLEITPANDELTELAKTFNDMLDRIQGGINQQQKFVLDASHELITPAAAIYGCVDLLKNYGADDKTILNENLDIIADEVRIMDNILQNLLFIARADQNRQNLHKEKLELANIVEYAVDTARVMAPNHNIDLAQNDDAAIIADDAMIRQLVRIILDNAVKFTPKGGTVTVASINTGTTARLSISDNGIGIAEENLDKIFEPFFRLGEGSSGGLGLTIARWISNAHGISVSVDSKLGSGTTFTLSIPIFK